MEKLSFEDIRKSDREHAEEAPYGWVRIINKTYKGRKFPIHHTSIYPLAGPKGRVSVVIQAGYSGFQIDLRDYNLEDVQPIDDKARAHLEYCRNELSIQHDELFRSGHEDDEGSGETE